MGITLLLCFAETVDLHNGRTTHQNIWNVILSLYVVNQTAMTVIWPLKSHPCIIMTSLSSSMAGYMSSAVITDLILFFIPSFAIFFILPNYNNSFILSTLKWRPHSHSTLFFATVLICIVKGIKCNSELSIMFLLPLHPPSSSSTFRK